MKSHRARDEKKINENKKKSIVTSLDNKAKELLNSSPTHHRLTKEEDGNYIFYNADLNKSYTVVPEVGYLTIDGKKYDSIDQFILML